MLSTPALRCGSRPRRSAPTGRCCDGRLQISLDNKKALLLLDKVARQMPFATAQALNRTAKLAAAEANAAMPSIFQHANRFTQMAVTAPSDMLAKKNSLTATVTLKPLQAKYLGLEIIGGMRTPMLNTRLPSQALVLPGSGTTPLRSGAIKRLAQQAAADQARQTGCDGRSTQAPQGISSDTGVFKMSGHGPFGGAGGFFRRLPGHHLTRLVSFESSRPTSPNTTSKPRSKAR